MSKKKKIFISHNYEDEAKAKLLKEQLANSSDIEVTYVSETPLRSDEIVKSINVQINGSSMMMVMLGEKWGRWQ